MNSPHPPTRSWFRRISGFAAVMIAAAIASTGAVPAQAAGPAPVPTLEVSRYLGTWNQLAAIPAPFSLACARDTRATYSLLRPGTIAVQNGCTTWSGSRSEVRGTAAITDPVSNAQLRVEFPTASIKQPPGIPNYIVTGLSPTYSWAVVANPDRTSGFVLARALFLDDASWREIRRAIVRAGQNPCLYLTSPATGGVDGIAPLCAIIPV